MVTLYEMECPAGHRWMARGEDPMDCPRCGQGSSDTREARALVRPCKACGAMLAFVPGLKGKDIPLDLRANVYRANGGVACPARDAFVSHFATCTAPSRFARKNAPAPGAGGG